MLRPTLYAVALTALLAAPLLAQTPGFREVKVGDSFPIQAKAAPVYASPQSEAAPAPAPVAQAAAPVAYADPYGFGSWLNGVRARMGLRPLYCDAGLCNDAAVNSSRGFGHSYMGRARRQNAGVGNGATVWPMWISSPAHAAALFDRSITAYGISCINGIWTFNAH